MFHRLIALTIVLAVNSTAYGAESKVPHLDTSEAIKLVQGALNRQLALSSDQLDCIVPTLTSVAEFDSEAQFCLAYCQSNKQFKCFDMKQAVSGLLRASESNHTDAQLAISALYLDDVGGRFRPKETLYWAKRVTSQANLSKVAIRAYLLQAKAQYLLKSPEDAAAALRDAAALENFHARLLLAHCHLSGIAEGGDGRLAKSCLKRAAATETQVSPDTAVKVARAALASPDSSAILSHVVPYFMLSHFRRVGSDIFCKYHHPDGERSVRIVEFSTDKDIADAFKGCAEAESGQLGVACDLQFRDNEETEYDWPLVLVYSVEGSAPGASDTLDEHKKP